MTRHLPSLILGLVAGVAIGYLAWHGAVPARLRARPSVLVVPPAASPPEGPAPREQRDAVDRTALRPDTDREVVAPEGTLPAGEYIEDGLGRIVIDFTGMDDDPGVEMDVTTLDGRRERRSFSAQDGLEWEDLLPGEYLPFWEPSDRLGRFGVRVRVAAGQLTRVRADDATRVFELPVPERLGQLDVTVVSVDGIPLSFLDLSLHGRGPSGHEWIEGTTDAQGRVRFEALPGTYSVQAGARAMPVEMVAKERVLVELRPENEGEVYFDIPTGAPRPRLQPAGTDRPGRLGVWWAHAVDGGLRQGFVFLAPGRYDVRLCDSPMAPVVGTVECVARQATWFAGATGGIRATLAGVRPEQGLEVTAERGGREGWALVVRIERPEIATGEEADESYCCLPFLSPGTYRVRGVRSDLFPSQHRETEETVVEVGNGWTEVRLRFADAH